MLLKELDRFKMKTFFTQKIDEDHYIQRDSIDEIHILPVDLIP